MEFLVELGWVGLGWLCGGDKFILSVRLSILAFSNWRWFGDNCRPNEENIIFNFWDSWLGWLCGGDMFILSVRLSILAFSNWRWFEGKNRVNTKTSSLAILD